jgi:hypothetical protein
VPEIIVRTIAYIKSEGREVDKNFILNKLKADDFNENWDSLCLMYRFSIDYLNENHLLVSQDWLPYENMLIPMMIFAKEIGGDFHKMNQHQKDFLTFWYLNSVFSLRFSGSSNERIVEDTKILTQVAKNQKITSPSFFNRLTKILIQSDEDIYSYNRKGNAIYKGVLNLINYHSKGLIDWNNNSKLSLNSILEDHHIFPQ